MASSEVARAQRVVLQRLVEIFRAAPMIDMLGRALTTRLMGMIQSPLADFESAYRDVRQAADDHGLDGVGQVAVVGVMDALVHLSRAQAKRMAGASEARQMASMAAAADAVSRAEAAVIAAIRARRAAGASVCNRIMATTH